VLNKSFFLTDVEVLDQRAVQKWPGGIVPYKFSKNLPGNYINAIIALHTNSDSIGYNLISCLPIYMNQLIYLYDTQWLEVDF